MLGSAVLATGPEDGQSTVFKCQWLSPVPVNPTHSPPASLFTQRPSLKTCLRCGRAALTLAPCLATPLGVS